MPRGRPFQPGNPGGPGRPRRAVETDYLAVTVGAVSVADWTRIVKRAVAQAIKGDAKAREWLSKQLIGTDPIPLQNLVQELQDTLREVLVYGERLEANGATTLGGGPLGPAAAAAPALDGRNAPC